VVVLVIVVSSGIYIFSVDVKLEYSFLSRVVSFDVNLNEVEVVIDESSGLYVFSVDVSNEYTSLSKDVSFDEKLDEGVEVNFVGSCIFFFQ
jgi:hypothetical protein